MVQELLGILHQENKNLKINGSEKVHYDWALLNTEFHQNH